MFLLYTKEYNIEQQLFSQGNGKQMMKSYAQGPVDDDERSCTDCFCCFVLLALIIVMFGMGIFAWTQGNFQKLSTPYDPDGKGCGVDYPSFAFIYFASPHPDSLHMTVCVRTCPKEGDTRLDCQPNSKVGCQPINSANNQQAVQIYDTFPMRAVCMPTSTKIQQQISQGLSNQTIITKVAALKNTWQVLLMAIPIAVVLSLVFMCIMRLLAGAFVYLLFIAAIVSFLGFGIYLILPQNSTGVAGIQINRTFVIILGVIFTVLGAVLLFIFVCYHKRIKLAAAVTKVAAGFVNENCLLLIVPVILFFVTIIFLAVWILQALGYYSMGKPVQQDNQLPFQHYQTTTFIKILGLIHLFQLFWVMCFMIQTDDFLTAGTAVSWYFQRQNPFHQSRHRYFRYHMGSVAVGSFLMALVGFIKFVYELLKTQEQPEPQSCMYYWSKFCNCCCFLCVTYLFNWFNSGAYTFIHISGDNYCSSAWQVLALRVKNPVATSIITFMEALFSLLVKLGITAATCGICYIILTSTEPYKNQVHDLTFPLLSIGVIGFVISSFFVSLYSEGMQAIYVSFLADSDAGGRDRNAPTQLRSLLMDAKKQNHFVE